jgi:hypothetical protein
MPDVPNIDPTNASISNSDFIEVPKPLSQAEVDAFLETGFHVAEKLISEAELEELKSDAVALARGKYPSKTFKPLPNDIPDSEALQNILCIHQPHYISPVIEKYVKHPQICGILSQTAGAHLPWWDGSVKCMQSMYFVKPPTFPGQAWHQDEIYIPTRDRSLIGAWIAIDDASVNNGCLWVVPGSHKSGYLYPQRQHQEEGWDASAESYGFDDAAKVPVEVPAGSVVFFNGHLLHCSHRNTSDIYRRVLVSHYMNAYSFLPWEHIGDGKMKGSVATADVRRVIPVAGYDPFAWKGYEKDMKDCHLRPLKREAAKA